MLILLSLFKEAICTMNLFSSPEYGTFVQKSASQTVYESVGYFQPLSQIWAKLDSIYPMILEAEEWKNR